MSKDYNATLNLPKTDFPMRAGLPKREPEMLRHWQELDINCHVGTIGAVFDFFAGTAQRAPLWWQEHGLEWLYRLIKEPRRMWRRYVIGNPLFIWNILKEKYDR